MCGACTSIQHMNMAEREGWTLYAFVCAYGRALAGSTYAICDREECACNETPSPHPSHRLHRFWNYVCMCDVWERVCVFLLTELFMRVPHKRTRARW